MSALLDNLRASVTLETHTGPGQTAGDLTITPVARSLTIGRARSSQADEAGSGGVLLTRTWPSAVLVSEDGRTTRLRIVDVTRWAQIAILLFAIITLFLLSTRTRTRKERSWMTPSKM